MSENEAAKDIVPGPEDYQLHPGYWANRSRNDLEHDWKIEAEDWIKGYVKSREHPHRALIVNVLEVLAPFESVLEVGCNCGPNLMLIREKFPDVHLAGIDLNSEALSEGKQLLPSADLRLGNLIELPWENRSFDVVISDAVFLYVHPREIEAAMSELNRVTRRAIVMVERFDESPKGEVRGHVWGRNYPALLSMLGFEVEQIKIDEKTWPYSFNWARYGYVFVAKR